MTEAQIRQRDEAKAVSRDPGLLDARRASQLRQTAKKRLGKVKTYENAVTLQSRTHDAEQAARANRSRFAVVR